LLQLSLPDSSFPLLHHHLPLRAAILLLPASVAAVSSVTLRSIAAEELKQSHYHDTNFATALFIVVVVAAAAAAAAEPDTNTT